MAAENAQRLANICGEAATACLGNLRAMCQEKNPKRVSQLFQIGLDTIPTWNSEIIAQESNKLLNAYPETDALFKFCILLLADLIEWPLPKKLDFPLFFHKFLQHVATVYDVKDGLRYFQISFSDRRSIHLHAVRNALHDILRTTSEATILSRVDVPVVTADDSVSVALTRETLAKHDTKSHFSRIMEEEKEKSSVLQPPSSVQTRSIDIIKPCFFEGRPHEAKVYEDEPRVADGSSAWMKASGD